MLAARSTQYRRVPGPIEHDPESWVPVFPRDKREAFARRSSSNKKIERDDDSKKSHPALETVLEQETAAPTRRFGPYPPRFTYKIRNSIICPCGLRICADLDPPPRPAFPS